MNKFMNIFTIITTILNLSVCTYAAFKKDNPTYSQQIALLKDPTLIFSSPLSSNDSAHDDVAYDNYKFKTSIIYYSILALLGVIFVAWFIYGWTTLNVSEESIRLLTIGAKFNESLFFSLFNTAKCTILSICILSFGLLYKNYKNPNSSYRIFHLIFYSLLAFSVIANFVLLLSTEYKYFLPNTSVSTSSENLLDNFFLSEAPIFLVLQIGLIIICVYKLSHACIFGEYKSSRIRINFQHITERILAPIIFILFTVYIIFLNGHI